MVDVHIIKLEPASRCRTVSAISTPPGLSNNVLTADAKRWQLWGKGIRGAAADEVLERLYGPAAVQTEAVNKFCELAREAPQ